MERRSERLANLQRLNPPISYRETGVKRVFKRIRRRRTVSIVTVTEPEVEHARPIKKIWVCLLLIMLAISFGIQCGLHGSFHTWKQQMELQLRRDNEALQRRLQKDIIACRQNLLLDTFENGSRFVKPQKHRFPQLGGSTAGSRYIPKEDFALKSSGASVVKTSKSFNTGAHVCVWKFCWEYSRSPDVILERDNTPGNCWAMNGREGYVVIKLSEAIRPGAVTVDHIEKMVSFNKERSSAPKYVSVYGLKDEFLKQEGTFLGTFMYRIDGSSTQTFRLEEENSERFKYLQFRILDNWGHPNYTCIYGFRVYRE